MTKEVKAKILKLKREGKSYSEISEVTGVSAGTIKSIVSRSKKENIEINFCKHCGKEITQTEGKRRKEFCSDSCRIKWWKLNKGVKNKCLHCGTSFISAKSYNQKYCSHKCFLAERFGKECEVNG